MRNDSTKNQLNHDTEVENEMVDGFEDVVELGKEMEQISEENDEDNLDKAHDASVRSDLDD
ncbi:SAS053 family DNA gyrase inhibitor [Staphylococcus nepalensis]|uniref:SAS053 family DNA gyrase inhibitor n=1 Tax=Staphylococcus nepalensis TaxID=214473 RepID=UPI000E0783F2|nr:SAS053 family protein [Staphylococcus nepalensis]SUM67912.1 putative uncharcterised protein [Staphylococcus nepalensis]SUM95363.1 putative uncharcterised protein [Staphylococcus nepalensis]